MQHPPPSSPFDVATAVSRDDAERVWQRSAPPAAPSRWTSEALLGGAREVEIEHQGAIYRLKITSLGKLILTK